MLRFIHLTDTHIGPAEAFELYDRRPLQYLRRAVEEINALPFTPAFVLHTGDVVDDGSPEAYSLYDAAMDELALPVHHVVGNHDNPERLQRMIMGIDAPLDRLDYTFDAAGVRFIVLDTRGPLEPGGRLEADQLDWLRDQVGEAADGMPLVIALHHAIVPLDTPWLDAPPPGWGGRFMFTENGADVRAVLATARDRVRCVLSGHVHGAFVTQLDGILYAPAQSVFAGLVNGPTVDRVAPDRDPLGHYTIVTLTDDGQTLIRPQSFAV